MPSLSCPLCSAPLSAAALEPHLRLELRLPLLVCQHCPRGFCAKEDADDHFRGPTAEHPGLEPAFIQPPSESAKKARLLELLRLAGGGPEAVQARLCLCGRCKLVCREDFRPTSAAFAAAEQIDAQSGPEDSTAVFPEEPIISSDQVSQPRTLFSLQEPLIQERRSEFGAITSSLAGDSEQDAMNFRGTPSAFAGEEIQNQGINREQYDRPFSSWSFENAGEVRSPEVHEEDMASLQYDEMAEEFSDDVQGRNDVDGGEFSKPFERESEQEKVGLELETKYDGKITCRLCMRRLYAHARAYHVQWFHIPDKHFRCLLCPFTTKVRSEVSRHQRKSHGREMTPSTFASTLTKAVLKQWISRCFGDAKDPANQTHLCRPCNEEVQRRHVTTHVSTVHLKEPLQKCRLCDYASTSAGPSQIMKHLRKEHRRVICADTVDAAGLELHAPTIKAMIADLFGPGV